MIGALIPDKFISIYGAGFSGLVLAHQLKKSRRNFLLYEKQFVGGKISSHISRWGPLESAASTLYMNTDAEKFIQELGLPYLNATLKLKRQIWRPEGPVSIPTPGMITSLGVRAFKRFPLLTETSTVEEILLPFFGRRYTDELLSSSLQGIYTAEARDLHFLSLFPWAKNKTFSNYLQFILAMKSEMKAKAAVKIRGSISFSGGMQKLIERLREDVSTNICTRDHAFELKDNTILCTSAPDAAELLQTTAPDVAGILKEIEYQPVTSYGIILKHDLPQLKESFGLLIPQKYGSPVLGILQQSSIFPQNYRAPCYTVICKGKLSVAEVESELKKRIKNFHSDEVLERSLKSWTDGLPLYNLKRYRAIQQLKKLLVLHPGLMLFGNYTGGISLRSIIEQARKLVL